MPASSSAAPAAPSSPLNSVFSALQRKYPQYSSQFTAAHKAAAHASSALDQAAPYLSHVTGYASSAKEQAAKYRLEEFVPMVVGLALCFFGGAYTMLIAVVETVRLLCWEDLKRSFEVLRENYALAAEQSRKDDMVDADGNGVADVLEMDAKQLFSRKAALFIKSVDIDAMQGAARTIGAAFMSVIAALRVKLARSLALGGSLASMAGQYVQLDKILHDVLPPDMKRWAATLSNVLLSMITMTLATLLSSMISMVHCCLRGSDMFVQHAIALARERGLLEDNISMESTKAKALVAVVAATGFLWQLSHAGAQPFPINVVLLPLSVAEWVLNVVVNVFLFSTPQH